MDIQPQGSQERNIPITRESPIGNPLEEEKGLEIRTFSIEDEIAGKIARANLFHDVVASGNGNEINLTITIIHEGKTFSTKATLENSGDGVGIKKGSVVEEKSAWWKERKNISNR